MSTDFRYCARNNVVTSVLFMNDVYLKKQIVLNLNVKRNSKQCW